jgi:hypothetical protein
MSNVEKNPRALDLQAVRRSEFMMNDGKLEDATARHANQRQSREDVARKSTQIEQPKGRSQRVGPLVGVPALVVPVTEQNRSNGTQILPVHRQALY